MRRNHLAVALALALLLPATASAQEDALTRGYTPEQCPGCAGWNEPSGPVHIYGNTYWVGTRGLGAILIASAEGHVLIDGGLPNSAPLILENIRALGFDPRDVRIILNSHSHYDHAGGFAALQRATGAQVAVRAPSVEVVRRGSTTPADPQHYLHLDMPPVENVQVVDELAPLQVGSLELMALPTGGHTPGGTSWTWRSCERAGCYTFVYADSQTPISDDDFRYSGDARYPDALADFERGFALLESVPCDVLLTPHPGASRMWERLAAGPEGLVDATACRAYAQRSRSALAERLERERVSGD